MQNMYFDNYDKKYPEIVIEILEYFEISNNYPDALKDKSVLKFCEQHNDDNQFTYQPTIVNRICKRLCEKGVLECIRSSGGLGLYDNYLFFVNNQSSLINDRERLTHFYNCMVYGFEYIYEMYKDLVVPFVWEKENGDYAAGTGFKFLNGIVTAKHCIKEVTNIQIKGYKASELKGKPVYISDDEGIDIAFIETGSVAEPIIYTSEGEIMQEVLVMGYPKIPAFTTFLTAEKATISSKASSRITPTMGAIAAYGYEYLTKMDAMLITARIQGGNSGGPVINQNGCLVGVACQILDASLENGDYDDLGYGVAVPVKYVTDIISRKPIRLSIPQNFYKDFIE